jgi:Domain of unknown function (DUF4258)
VREPRLTIRWGIHALERMTLHRIDLEEVRQVVAENERIEDYPDDQPYPSALLLGWSSGRPLHVVVAYFPGRVIRIVTAYRPDPERWDASYRQRRRQ